MLGPKNAMYIDEKYENDQECLKVESVQDQKSPAVAD